jgi:hypothetical protein
MADRGKQQRPDRAGELAVTAPGTAEETTGTLDARLAQRLVEEVAGACPREGLAKDRRAAWIEGALAALKGLGPGDELEGMLTAQMVATHGVAMDCFGRAMSEGGAEVARKSALVQGARLLGIYARQVETLGRYRARTGGGEKSTISLVWGGPPLPPR